MALKKMSKQGKVLILALLAFLIFFVGFKIYHSKDVQASTIKLVNKSNETYAYSGSKKINWSSKKLMGIIIILIQQQV